MGGISCKDNRMVDYWGSYRKVLEKLLLNYLLTGEACSTCTAVCAGGLWCVITNKSVQSQPLLTGQPVTIRVQYMCTDKTNSAYNTVRI